MPVRIENVTLDCRDERVLGAFWRAALGYESSSTSPMIGWCCVIAAAPGRRWRSKSCLSQRW
jgi:hypothetical protein